MNRILQRIKSRLLLLLGPGKRPQLANFESIDGKVDRILCATAAGIGDMVMVAAAIKTLKQTWPNASLTVLCHYNRGGEELCRLIPAVDETIDVGLDSFRWPTVIAFMLGRFWKLLFKMRRRRFDLAVVFRPNVLRRFILAGTGCKYWIYGNRIDDYPGTLAFELLRTLGCKPAKQEDVFKVPAPANSEKLLPDNLEGPFIGIHPFCGTKWRGWNKFNELQKESEKLAGTTILLGRKPGLAKSTNVCNLVNKLSIAELFRVIKQLDVFITADSGPMHIAFALGVPTVALFGPVRPALRIPPGKEDNITVLYRPSAASESPRHITRRRELDNIAMQSITVEEVLAATKQLLEKH